MQTQRCCRFTNNFPNSFFLLLQCSQESHTEDMAANQSLQNFHSGSSLASLKHRINGSYLLISMERSVSSMCSL